MNYFKDNWPNIMALILLFAWSILNIFGIWENITWIKNNELTIIIMLITACITLLTQAILKIKKSIDKYNTKLDDRLRNITDKIEKHPQINACTFTNIAEVYKYIAEKIYGAKQYVEDITWGSYTNYRTEEEQTAYKEYENSMKVACAKKNISYKEVSSLSDIMYLNRSKELFKFTNYSLRYYNIDNYVVPLNSYIIIDKKEVILGFLRERNRNFPKDSMVFSSITEPNLVAYYIDYFNSLWEKSQKIKESNIIDNNKLNEIENKLGNKGVKKKKNLETLNKISNNGKRKI